MDPSSLFAPGGIVQGMSDLGNSIGDSFKSYALIRKERDDADMARTKMIFDAQDKIQQQKLEQQRLDAQMKMWQGQQAMEQQRIGQAATFHADTMGMEQKRMDAARQAQQSTQADATSMFAAEHGAYQGGIAGAPYDPMKAGISQQAQSDRAVKLGNEGIVPTEMFQAPGASALTNPAGMMNPTPTPAGQAYQNYQHKQQMSDMENTARAKYWADMGGAKKDAVTGKVDPITLEKQKSLDKIVLAHTQDRSAINEAWTNSPEYKAAVAGQSSIIPFHHGGWSGNTAPSPTPPPEWVQQHLLQYRSQAAAMLGLPGSGAAPAGGEGEDSSAQWDVTPTVPAAAPAPSTGGVVRLSNLRNQREFKGMTDPQILELARVYGQQIVP